MNEDWTIEEEIISILDVIRPYINGDGGDVEFIRFENGIVYIRLTGACQGCASADITINEGIKDLLVENIPDVVDVVAV